MSTLTLLKVAFAHPAGGVLLAISEHPDVNVGAEGDCAKVRGSHQYAASAGKRIKHKIALAHLQQNKRSEWGRFSTCRFGFVPAHRNIP